MLKRPSSRRRSSRQEVQLNLVPILDTMVTLIGFLLFTMSFLALVHMESPFPVTTQEDSQEKIKERPLQLTVTLRENEVEVWSPFDRIESKKIPNLPDGAPQLKLIHEIIIQVKQKFPKETKLVLVPYPAATYDTLIATMDSLRLFEPTDPPVFLKNESTGVDEKVNTLFPEIIFGNLLGDNS